HDPHAAAGLVSQSAARANGALDVVGLGNALVDVLSHESDEFVEAHGLVKGSMELIDAAQAERLYGTMGPATETSGGSVANAMVGSASCGGSGAFTARAADAQIGTVSGHATRAAGVPFATPPAADGLPSGRCLVLVTPDAERTMNTFLGAASQFGPED